MNESSGTNVPDNSGNGRDGTTNGSPTWQAGKLNNCLKFNGSSQSVNCGSIAGFERSDSFSVEYWLKSNVAQAADYGVILGNYDEPNIRGWMAYIDRNNGWPYILLANSITNYLQVRVQTGLVNNNWHHVVITYNGSSQSSGIVIYIDGNVGTKDVIKDNLAGTIVNSLNCLMARNNTGF
jgi:hypothetical protein